MNQDFQALANRPLLLRPNRVKRYYRGGMMIDRWQRMTTPNDNTGSEEWVASTVHALPRRRVEPAESAGTVRNGLTVVDFPGVQDITLRDLLEAAPEAFLGRPHLERFGHSFGLLVKLLDLADPIPVHVHPTRTFAQRNLNSPFGKNEAWIVLNIRSESMVPQPSVWLGFRKNIKKGELRRWIDSQDNEAMYDALHRIEIGPGEVLFVPAGLPHALGKGLFVLEPQEPTDFSLTIEYGRYNLDPAVVSWGLGWDKAIDCIDFTQYSREAIIDRCKCEAECLRKEEGGNVWNLLNREAATFLQAQRIMVGDLLEFPGQVRCAVDLTIQGQGMLGGAFGEMEVIRGRSLFLPASLENYYYRRLGDEPLEIIRCLPPINA